MGLSGIRAYSGGNGGIYGPLTGNVVGPASSTDNAIARWNGTTGRLLKDSSVTISDAGIVTAPILVGGTTTTSTLTLRSTSGVGIAGADIIFQTGNNGATEAMRILNSGFVGMGISPTVRLDVNGATRFGDGSQGYITTSLDGHRLMFSRANVSHINATNASGFLGFGTGGVDQVMTISAVGNVAIGNTSPPAGQKLDVQSAPSAGLTQIRAYSNSGTNVSYGGFLGQSSANRGIYFTIGDASWTNTYYSHAGEGVIATSSGAALAINTNATNNNGLMISTTGLVTVNAGDLSVSTAGKGLNVKEGSNARMGAAVLVAGTVVVSTTAVTANSRIFLTSNVDGGTPSSAVRVSDRTAATSFTITSANALDTSTVAWLIMEPSA